MSSDSQEQRQRNTTEAYIEHYSLERIEEISRKLMKKHKIENRHKQTAFESLPEPSLATLEMPRLKKLKKKYLYDSQFLGTKRFNISIIDLHTEDVSDLKFIARYLERSLVSLGGRGESDWVIHIFCCKDDGSRKHTLTPISMSLLLLNHLSVQLRNRPSTNDKDWGSIKVEHKPTKKEDPELPYHQYIMEILTELIYQILEKCPRLFMHFVFSGIVLDHHYEDLLHHLAHFMIDMGRLVGYVDPIGENRMVKCIFSGVGLLDKAYLWDIFMSERGKEFENPREKAEIEDIFVQTLMLDWNRHRRRYQTFEVTDDVTDDEGKQPASS